jgi:hypothetical protein
MLILSDDLDGCIWVFFALYALGYTKGTCLTRCVVDEFAKDSNVEPIAEV